MSTMVLNTIAISFFELFICESFARYTAKQIIKNVHANPNTQPAGVHGAFMRFRYQSDVAPLFIKRFPTYKTRIKFIKRNNRDLLIVFILSIW